MKTIYKHSILFIIFLILGGLISLCHKQGTSWDLLNYHLYIPWAFFNNRIDVDFCACGVHSYLNPIGMLPYYFLTEYLNDFPRLVAIMQGFNWSILAFLVYLISYKMIKTNKEYLNIFLSFISSIIGSTTAVIYMQIGLGTIGLSCFIPILLGLYILINNFENKKNIFFSGLFCGFAVGLKLTNGIYLLTIFLSLACYLLFYKKLSVKELLKKILFFVLGSAIGFFVINGFWMVILYEKFKNPFFPMFNNFFKSEFYTQVAYHDDRFAIKNILDFLILPLTNLFQLIENKEEFYGEVKYILTHYPVYDMRFGIEYICCILLAFFLNNSLVKKINLSHLNLNLLNFLLCFFFFSYTIWIIGFCILRYFVPSLILSGLFILIAFYIIAELTKKYKLCISLLVIIIILIFSTQYSYCNYQRIHFKDKTIKIEDLKLEDNSTVVFADKLMSYIVLKQNKNVKYIGFDIDADGKESLKPTEAYYQEIYSILNNSRKIYMIINGKTREEKLKELNSLLDDELKLEGHCRKIETNLNKHFNYKEGYFNLYICE